MSFHIHLTSIPKRKCIFVSKPSPSNTDCLMKALIIGATGATGRDLVEQLLADPDVKEVHVFIRKARGLRHEKLHTHIVDFEHPERWADSIQGDVAFSCLGTTAKIAGSQAAQHRVDVVYPLHFAHAARQNGVPTFVLLSAAGAKPDSRLFYNRIKGELEEGVKSLCFPKTIILQPGVLDRKGSDRWAENLGVHLFHFFNRFGLFRKYRPMPTALLAEKMIKLSKKPEEGVRLVKLHEIFDA